MKRQKTFSLVAPIALSGLLAPPALAFNELFASRGPLSFLTKSDVTIARSAIRAALDSDPDGHTHTWTNPETQASGTVTPTKTYKKDGMRCRSAEFTTHAGGLSGQSVWDLCKTKDGWKIVTGR